MSNNKFECEVTAEELQYLKQAAIGDGEVGEALATCSGIVITLDHALAERLRGYLTETLARVGFDENYMLTREGEILEQLLDKLHIG